MLIQVGERAQFAAFFSRLGIGVLGLSVAVDVWNPAGALVAFNAPAVEVGGGFYRYELSPTLVILSGPYMAVFKSADATVDAQQLPAIELAAPWVDYAVTRLQSYWPGKLDVVVSPFTLAGDIVLQRGDSYEPGLAGALSFRNAAGSWPDLTLAIVTLEIGSTMYEATVVTPSGVNQEVTVTLPAAIVLAMQPSTMRFALRAVWNPLDPAPDRVTLQKGVLVIEDVP